MKTFQSETEEMRGAFDLWVGLGKGRSFRKVAKMINRSAVAVGDWAKFFKWGERLTKMESVGVDTNLPALPPVMDIPNTEDEVTNRLGRLADLLEGFLLKAAENMGKTLDNGFVMSAKELMGLAREYRDTLVAKRRGVPVAQKPQTKISKLTMILNNLPLEDQIEFLNIGKAQGAVITRGSSPVAGGDQEADYVEVFNGGAEDGAGCDVVPGSAGGGEGGDASELSESRSRVSLSRFV